MAWLLLYLVQMFFIKAHSMLRKVLVVFFTIITVLFSAVTPVSAEDQPKSSASNRYLKVIKGHSYPLSFSSNIDTLVVGDPNVIQVSTLKPNLIMISGQVTGSTSLTIFGEQNQIIKYVIQVVSDHTQLQALINQIERNVTVEEVADVIVLKGKVKTAAALTRVLSLADRYVSTVPNPNFSVISDKGGVLAGNTNEGDEVEPVLQTLAAQTLIAGGGGRGGASAGGGGRGSASAGGRGGGGVAAAIRQPLYPNKGNLAQNISRGDVVMAAGGRVMSLIKVESQPKVEIQMQIVAVDRNKTDELGWDWRITGIKDNGTSSTGITIGGLLGGISPSIVSGIGESSNSSALNVGSSTLASVISHVDTAKGLTLGLVSFLRLVEQKGAGTTLSEPIITALSGESASFLVGGSLPIPVQALSAGSATQNAVVATNVSFVQYGLSLIVRPTVLENGNISVVLDQSISEPDYTNAFTLLGTPIPSFKQKTISTLTESASGETWAVAGLLTEEDTKTMSEVPFFSQIPVLGQLFKKKNDRVSRNELFIVVNARRVDGVNDTTQNFDGVGRLQPKDSEDLVGFESQDETIQDALETEGNVLNKNKQSKNNSRLKQPTIINGQQNNAQSNSESKSNLSKKSTRAIKNNKRVQSTDAVKPKVAVDVEAPVNSLQDKSN